MEIYKLVKLTKIIIKINCTIIYLYKILFNTHFVIVTSPSKFNNWTVQKLTNAVTDLKKQLKEMKDTIKSLESKNTLLEVEWKN